MTNIPIILFTVSTPYFSVNYLSRDEYNLMSLYFFSYVLIYLINYLFLNTLVISIIDMRKNQGGIFYFNRLSNIISSFSTNTKHITAIILLIIAGFPPTINFVLKFQLFYSIFYLNNLFLTSLTIITLNTFLIYCYLRILGRILNSISIQKL